ncbi:GNAT family N-acetyltransferase [Micromonospora matsumotoense]|uniref:GNAT family N-acetyltransferase n=1 Tax=Micromonospora matsumotoense TaxID=121616 RepID=UPI0034123B1A
MAPQTVDVHIATFTELDARTFHDLLRLRLDVFVVEQRCPYPELDGRDVEPGTRHLWLTRPGALPHDDALPHDGAPPHDGALPHDGAPPRDGDVLAYLRLLADPGGVTRIGRVVVAPAARGGGLAGRLMTEALRLVGDRPCVLEAQAHLAGFYAGHGFTATGPQYVEDGIPHLPMRRQH